MSGQAITVIATHQARPAKETKLKSVNKSCRTNTQGRRLRCVSRWKTSRFIFHETWTSKAHFEAHLQSALIKVLLPHLNELCERLPNIEIWEKLHDHSQL